MKSLLSDRNGINSVKLGDTFVVKFTISPVSGMVINGSRKLKNLFTITK